MATQSKEDYKTSIVREVRTEGVLLSEDLTKVSNLFMLLTSLGNFRIL